MPFLNFHLILKRNIKKQINKIIPGGDISVMLLLSESSEILNLFNKLADSFNT
jgi:hypothetical protein